MEIVKEQRVRKFLVATDGSKAALVAFQTCLNEFLVKPDILYVLLVENPDCKYARNSNEIYEEYHNYLLSNLPSSRYIYMKVNKKH